MSVRIAKDTLSPSLADTIKVSGEAFDLTDATVVFRMRAVNSATLKIDDDATVVSEEDGTVRYDWQEGDTDTEGDFLGWWRVTLSTGKVQETPEFVIEVFDHATESDWLVSLAELKMALEVPTGDTSRDATFESFIERASVAIARDCRREFRGPSGEVSRDFRWKMLPTIDLAPYDLQSLTSVTLHPDEDEEDELTDGTEVIGLPIDSPHGVYTRLRFAADIDVESTDFYTRFGFIVVRVAGTWGFPSVPSDVAQAAIVTVSSWLEKGYAEQAADGWDEPRGTIPRPAPNFAIPGAAWRLLSPFARRQVY
jgi:hypothetical protein